MLTSSTLLTQNGDDIGSFSEWLKKNLGLADFLRSHPISKLIDWKWLQPQYRVVFPAQFFAEWENYPERPWTPSEELNTFSVLWDYSWGIDPPEVPLWFLDPIFRTGEPICDLLESFACTARTVALPTPIIHKSGRHIFPYLDYFYHWQGLALVDVIYYSDCLEPPLRTPDLLAQTRALNRTAKHLISNDLGDPVRNIRLCGRWNALARPMTCLALFRSYRDAVFSFGDMNADLRQRYKVGAIELAKHLSLDAEELADSIKTGLLSLADEWQRAIKRKDGKGHWLEKAFSCLQREIELAVSWLILLTGQPYTFFVEKWQKPYFGNCGWAPLDAVLPYAFQLHFKKFSKLIPLYLRDSNPNEKKHLLDENGAYKFAASVRKLNHPFGGFLAAFHELHEHLSVKPFEEHGIDFRELRPLDQFAMLAIHAEGCLRRELDLKGRLQNLPTESQTLAKYIEELAKLKGLSTKVVGTYATNRKLADLKTDRANPIGRLQTIETKLDPTEHEIVQAFLSCLLARNYFAHHDFLDNELLNTDRAKFLLKGILLTILTLLSN